MIASFFLLESLYTHTKSDDYLVLSVRIPLY